ncbi:MAG: hypothetical protein KME30_05955 [Iphinoe sp. HA4291-MV1]|nr:hypothetical protein [Iphinoe sp. HA4291-MV1]
MMSDRALSRRSPKGHRHCQSHFTKTRVMMSDRSRGTGIANRISQKLEL